MKTRARKMRKATKGDDTMQEGFLTTEGGFFAAAARWNDNTAVATLLAPLPAGIATEIGESHRTHPNGFRGVRHHGNRGYVIVADAAMVVVKTLVNVTFLQAAEVWVRLDMRGSYSRTAVKDVYAEVTGRSLQWVQ